MMMACYGCDIPAPVQLPTPWPPPQGPSAGGSTLLTMLYRAKTITQAMADPGNGFIVWNTTGQTNASKLAVAARSDNNVDNANVWRNTWMVGKTLVLQHRTDSTQLERYTITAVVDHSTWFEVSVTPGPSSGAPFQGNNPLLVAVY